jgi:hypothetical protein
MEEAIVAQLKAIADSLLKIQESLDAIARHNRIGGRGPIKVRQK